MSEPEGAPGGRLNADATKWRYETATGHTWKLWRGDRLVARVFTEEDARVLAGWQRNYEEARRAKVDAWAEVDAKVLAERDAVRSALERARAEIHNDKCHRRGCECDTCARGFPCCDTGRIVDEVRVMIYPLLAVALSSATAQAEVGRGTELDSARREVVAITDAPLVSRDSVARSASANNAETERGSAASQRPTLPPEK